MILKHENATHELLQSLPADWPEAQAYLQQALPPLMGAASIADLEAFFQEDRYKLYLSRRKSDSEIVGATLVQISNNAFGVIGLLHFLFAEGDFESYAVEFVIKIEELLEEELQVVQFIAMARSPFTPIFNNLGKYAPHRQTIEQIHDWGV